jgi:hypothetical protein
MKLTSVEIHPDGSSNVLILSFRDPEGLNPYNVKDIKGLDADEIIPQYVGSPGGSRSYNLVQGSRVITLKMGLNPNYVLGQSVSDIRDDTYKMIASSRKGKVDIKFKDGNAIIAVISGHISKFEAAQFERLQEVQLTVQCDNTMLKGPDPVMVDVMNLDPERTFISDDLSTAAHGWTFELNFDDDCPDLVIFDPDDLWKFTISPPTGFAINDKLYFSNEKEKQLFVARGAPANPQIVQMAELVAPGSTWPVIFPGENHFKLNQYPWVTWNKISFYPTYWGV